MEGDVSGILEKYKTGSTKDYDVLLSNLNNPAIESGLFITYLKGLKDCVTLLGNEFEVLVGILLKVDWSSKEAAVVQEYQSFLVNLVSAHTFYLRACLRMLVKAFYPKPVEKKDLKVDGTVSETTRRKDEHSFVNLHLVLKAISQLVPMTSRVLLPLLAECAPYMTKGTYIQECYIKNLLQITHYMTTLRQQILELTIDMMTKLDVRSPRQEIEEAETKGDDEMDQDIFDMDGEDISQEMTQTTTTQINEKMNHADADKLDSMLELMYRYIQNMCRDSDGTLDWERSKILYRELLLVFERIILPTHASCHVQFIMFYLCSLRPAICEGFLDYLWKRVVSPQIEAVYRQASVAYIASLISRGRFISVGTLKACVELMCSWIHRYIEQASYMTTADLKHHGPFYAVCQAVFYVTAFRHKEILDSHSGYKWAKALNLQTIVTSRLNPLRVCMPLIVKTFAYITRSYQLAFCDTVIEKNKRATLPMATGCFGSYSISDANVLDVFFPFDPYLLMRSGKFIIPLYREYEGSPPEEEISDSEDEDDFLPETEKGDVTVATSLTSTGMSEFGRSTISDLMNYGISPGFKHIQTEGAL